jgi:hypothetical protein
VPQALLPAEVPGNALDNRLDLLRLVTFVGFVDVRSARQHPALAHDRVLADGVT